MNYRKMYSDLDADVCINMTEYERRKEDEYNLYDPECVGRLLKAYVSDLKERFEELPASVGVWIEDQDGNEVWSGEALMDEMFK